MKKEDLELCTVFAKRLKRQFNVKVDPNYEPFLLGLKNANVTMNDLKKRSFFKKFGPKLHFNNLWFIMDGNDVLCFRT